MTRLPGGPTAVYRPGPDIYTALLLIGSLFLLVACVVVTMDLMSNYGWGFLDLFTVRQTLPH